MNQINCLSGLLTKVERELFNMPEISGEPVTRKDLHEPVNEDTYHGKVSKGYQVRSVLVSSDSYGEMFHPKKKDKKGK